MALVAWGFYTFGKMVSSVTSWWRGEITGQQVAADVFESVGLFVGRQFGGDAGAVFGGGFGRKAAELVFGLPPQTALEKAYRYFGLEQSATNAEIERKHRELARRFHPDQGGTHDEFIRLQSHYSIILERRGMN